MVTSRNTTIDIIKGICCIFVIITHCEWSEKERLILGFPFWIDMAVPIFMAVSGYLYTISYSRRRINDLESMYQKCEILCKMIRYTIPMLIAYIIEIIYYSYTGYKFTFIEMIRLFIRGGIGPGSYYYPIMIQFIFLFPFIYFTIKRYEFKGLVGCWLANGAFELIQFSYGFTEEVYRLLIYRYIFIISFGCYIALEKSKIDIIYYILNMIIGILFLVANCYFSFQPIFITYWSRTSFIAVMYILPFIYFMFSINVKFKLIENIGKSSYNIFLTQMVYFSCGGTIQSCLSDNINYKFICILINIIICIVIGQLFYYLEKPLTQRLINKIRNSM